jgi:Divergent InlB B-repeat domain
MRRMTRFGAFLLVASLSALSAGGQPTTFRLEVHKDPQGNGAGIVIAHTGTNPLNCGGYCGQDLPIQVPPQQVVVDAHPDQGSVLTGWSSDPYFPTCDWTTPLPLPPVVPPCLVVLDKQRIVVTATFRKLSDVGPGTGGLVPKTHELKVVKPVNGTVTQDAPLSPYPINCGNVCSELVAELPPPLPIDLIAKPDAGYVLTGWSSKPTIPSCSASAPTPPPLAPPVPLPLHCIVNVNADVTVTATFSKQNPLGSFDPSGLGLIIFLLFLFGAGMFSLLVGLGALIGLGVMCLAAFSKKSPPCGCVQESAPDPCCRCHGTKGNYLRTPKSVAMWALPNLATVRDGMVAASKRNEQATTDIRRASEQAGASSGSELKAAEEETQRRAAVLSSQAEAISAIMGHLTVLTLKKEEADPPVPKS